jgi:hypothetical protein
MFRVTNLTFFASVKKIMDPREKKKPAFDEGAIIKLSYNGVTKRVYYNQISSVNLAMAFNLRTSALFLRRPDVSILL